MTTPAPTPEKRQYTRSQLDAMTPDELISVAADLTAAYGEGRITDDRQGAQTP